jgi:hypothetical protein
LCRKELFAKKVSAYFVKQHVESVSFKDLLSAVNQEFKAQSDKFSKKEAETYLAQMEEEGKVSFAEGQVYLI